jgi:type II secretion system protein H
MVKKVLLDRGFTLIEIVVVVALVGILSSIVLPDFKKTVDHYKLNVAAQQLSHNIRMVQQKAISEGVPYKILFDMNKRDYYIIKSALNGFQGKVVKLPEGVNFEWTSFTTNFNNSKNENTLIFSVSGAPIQAGTVALKNKNERLYVMVTVATGRVRISKIPPEW